MLFFVLVVRFAVLCVHSDTEEFEVKHIADRS